MRLAVALLALALSGGGALANDHSHGGAHGHSQHAHPQVGQPGDAKAAARTVEVTASDADGHMMFTPGALQVARGEQVRFQIRNAGALDHEFIIGTKSENAEHAKMMASMPDMKHNDSNAVTIPAGRTASLTWRFSKAGAFEFACLIPGHYESGMHGVVNVK